MSNMNHRPKTRGQALTEFALIAPLLLFLVLGIIDFGRALFTYAMGSNAVRDAVRYAEVLGYAGDTKSYLQCGAGGKMDKAAHNVFFVNKQTVDIHYIQAATGATVDCSDPDLATKLQSGDLVVVESKATVNFITPFLSNIFHSVDFDFKAQRTIIKEIALNPHLLEPENFTPDICQCCLRW